MSVAEGWLSCCCVVVSSVSAIPHASQSMPWGGGIGRYTVACQLEKH